MNSAFAACAEISKELEVVETQFQSRHVLMVCGVLRDDRVQPEAPDVPVPLYLRYRLPFYSRLLSAWRTTI
ncbi:hypothetical protein RUND412_011515 [Rhizina undulata]